MSILYNCGAKYVEAHFIVTSDGSGTNSLIYLWIFLRTFSVQGIRILPGLLNQTIYVFPEINCNIYK